MGQERRPSPQALALLARPQPVASHRVDAEFQDWYQQMADQYGLDPNPEGQFYDYRAAMRAGASPDASGHWPSQLKQPGHPNEVVGGFSTITGERVPGAPLARSEDELIQLGWEPETARQLWQSVQPTAFKDRVDLEGSPPAIYGAYRSVNPRGDIELPSPPSRTARNRNP